MHNNKILIALRSPNAVLAVLVLALVAQTPHAADVFRLIVHGTGVPAILHSYSFAIALELAVLLFVVQNRHMESYCFAGVSVAMNLSYYYLDGVQLFALSALPALLVSVALPSAIARYSHAVADVHDVDAEQSKPQRIRRTTVQVTRTDEQSEPAPVSVAIVPSAQIEQQPTIDLTSLNDEQKRQHVFELVRAGEQVNKSALAKQLGIGRTTLYGWLAEVNA